MELAMKRQRAMQDARRGLILEAARRVFMRSGVERSSMREIAKEAGYTPGALYAYFSGKQQLLSTLLADMVARIGDAVIAARAPKGQPERLLIARGQAWLAYLIANPRELELVVFLLSAGMSGAKAAQLAQSVHQGLRDGLYPMMESLTSLGLKPDVASQELEGALAFGLGLLLTQDHSRLQTPEMSPEFLYQRYLQQLLARYSSPAESTVQGAVASSPPQVNLF